MNKWQIICPVVAMLVVVIVLASLRSGSHRHVLVSAVTEQLDGHTPQIGELLAIMHGSNVTVIEDAAYHELQAIPSTSLISRSMIRVSPTADGFLECVIDTSPLNIAPRSIRAQQWRSPALVSAVIYTAKIINGQVFLSLNAKPDQVIGPFIKASDNSYTCKTQGEGVHSLTKHSTNGWYYSWSYIHMSATPVDGRVLEVR